MNGPLIESVPIGAARRQRLGLVLAALLAAILIAVAAVTSGGSAEVPPATGAATVVPADALAYVHVSIDKRRPGVQRALTLVKRFPGFPRLSASVLGRIGAIAGGSSSVDFDRDIRPWLGREAAIALLNTTTATAGSLIVFDVSDRGRAQAFLVRSGARSAGSYRGVALLDYSSGTEAAFVRGHFLVLGQDASVRSSIDVASDGSPSLAADPTYRRATAAEPVDRVLDAYASAAGIRRVLSSRTGVIGALGVLLDGPALAGVAVSLSAVPGGARLQVRSELDPSLVGVTGAAAAGFTPTLQRAIPSGAALLLDTSGFAKLAPRVLAAAAAAGVAGQIAPLLHRLGAALSAEGVNIKQILSIFSGETAVALVPGTAALGPPALVIVARAHHQASTREALAALEVPLAQLFSAPSSGPGQAPEFSDRQVGGVTARQLSLAPGLQLSYAVFDGLVVVSTSLDGIAAVAHDLRPVADEPAFQATLGGRPHQTTSLLFLDFSQLLSLGELTGLTRSAGFMALRPDLEQVRGVGLYSTSGETDTTAELFLQIP